MNAIPFTFDTLIYSKRLQEKGFTAEQAEAQVEMIKEIIDSQLATKQDIREVKQEIQNLEIKLEHQIHDVRRDINELKNQLIIKLGTVIIGSAGALGVLFSFLNKIH